MTSTNRIINTITFIGGDLTSATFLFDSLHACDIVLNKKTIIIIFEMKEFKLRNFAFVKAEIIDNTEKAKDTFLKENNISNLIFATYSCSDEIFLARVLADVRLNNSNFKIN